MPDDYRPVELEGIDDGCEVIGPAAEREVGALELATARATPKVDPDEAIARVEGSADGTPERALQAEPVNEHHGETFTFRLDVKLGTVDDEL